MTHRYMVKAKKMIIKTKKIKNKWSYIFVIPFFICIFVFEIIKKILYE